MEKRRNEATVEKSGWQLRSTGNGAEKGVQGTGQHFLTSTLSLLPTHPKAPGSQPRASYTCLGQHCSPSLWEGQVQAFEPGPAVGGPFPTAGGPLPFFL